MKKPTVGLIVFSCLVASLASGQVSMFSKAHTDSLKKGIPTGSLNLGFSLMQDAVKYLYIYTTFAGMIMDVRNQYEIISVLTYQGLRIRSTSNTGYVFAHAYLLHHKMKDNKCILQKINVEPFGLFQFDEDRGINARWQVGAYAVPRILEKPKIRIRAGFGLLYQWDRYDLLPPDYEGWWTEEEWKIIARSIHYLSSGDSGFASRNGVRGSVYLAFNSSFGKRFDWNVIAYYQQPLISNFKGTPLYDVSGDFRIPYPCITLETIMNFNVLSWLSMDIRFYLQHDRNQLTYYLPYFMYSITFGVYFVI